MDVFDLTAKITLDISNYLRGLDQARGEANGFGSTLKSGLTTAAKVGVAAVGAVTAAATKFGMDSVQTGMQFDQAMSQVAATLGTSVDEIEELSEFAQEMGRTTAFSATQSAQALNYMALAGYDAETSIKMLPSVMSLAAAGGLDLAYASDMVTDAQTALGLEIQDVGGFVNELAKTASTTNTSVGQLGEAILTIGGTAKFMSGGASELSQVLGLLADNGIKGSEAGTHLRNMLLKLSAPTKEGTDTMEALGLSVFDAEGKMRSFEDIFTDLNIAMANFTEQEKINAFSALFNTRDVAAATALLGTSVERWEQVGSAIASAWYSAQDLGEAFEYVGYGIDFDMLVGSFEHLGISAEDATDALNRSGGDVNAFVEALWEMADAGVSMEDIMDAMPADIDEVQLAFNRAAGAATEMSKTQLDNLAGDITLFNSALEGAKIAVSKGLTPALRDFVKFGAESVSELTDAFSKGGLESVIDSLAPMLAEGVSVIASYIPEIISLGSRFIGSFISSLWSKVPDMIDTGIAMLSSFAEGAQEAIPQFLAEVLPRIMELTGRLRERAGELVDAGLNIILDLLQGVINGLPEMLTYIPTIISNIAGIINDNMPKIVAAGIELIMMLVAGIIDAVPTLIAEFPKIIKAIFDVITAVNWVNLGANVIKWIANGIKGLFSMIPNLFRDMGTNAINLFKGFDWLGLGKTIIQFIVNGIKGLVTSIPNALKSIGQSALNAIKVMDWWGVGSGIISGIASGISNGVGAIMDAARNAARNALNAAKSFLGIHSPSSVFRDQVGKMMALGLGEGFEDNIPVDDMKSGVEEAIDEISGLSAPQIGFDDEGNGTRRNGFFATFNIYTDPSQDKESIAREVQDKFLTWYEQETAIA